MYNYLLLSLLLILVVLILRNRIENLKNTDNEKPFVKPKKILIRKDGVSQETDTFTYKSWDGTNWKAQIVGNRFYINQLGSSKKYIVNTINILRFRSMEWQLTILPNSDFLLFRLGGTTGIPYKTIDLIDIDDYSYSLSML